MALWCNSVLDEPYQPKVTGHQLLVINVGQPCYLLGCNCMMLTSQARVCPACLPICPYACLPGPCLPSTCWPFCPSCPPARPPAWLAAWVQTLIQAGAFDAACLLLLHGSGSPSGTAATATTAQVRKKQKILLQQGEYRTGYTCAEVATGCWGLHRPVSMTISMPYMIIHTCLQRHAACACTRPPDLPLVVSTNSTAGQRTGTPCQAEAVLVSLQLLACLLLEPSPARPTVGTLDPATSAAAANILLYQVRL